MKTARLGWLAVCMTCALAGCKGTGPSRRTNNTGGLEVSPDIVFDDVPIRPDFRLVESYTSQDDAARVGELRYSGRGPVLDVVGYFSNAMAAKGWKSITTVGSNDRMNLVFRKGLEICRVQVSSAGWRGRVMVHILVVGEKEHTP